MARIAHFEIPEGLTLTELLAEINDRLRRLSDDMDELRKQLAKKVDR